MITRSDAKMQLIDLLKTTAIGQTYSFRFDGSEYHAARYVQSMRSHLTRLRQMAIMQGKRPKHFKLLVEGVEPREDAETKYCQVAIRRTTAALNVDNDLADILLEVVG